MADPSILDRLETRIPPLVWMLLSIGVVVLISLVGDRAIPADRRQILWMVVTAVGIFIAVSAVFDFRHMGTTVDPMDIDKAKLLVTNGVFRFTRNPMYLGMLFVVLGMGLRMGSLAATVIGGGFFVAVLTRLQIIPEERVLAEHFGAEYDTFTKSVRRWI